MLAAFLGQTTNRTVPDSSKVSMKRLGRLHVPILVTQYTRTSGTQSTSCKLRWWRCCKGCPVGFHGEGSIIMNTFRYWVLMMNTGNLQIDKCTSKDRILMCIKLMSCIHDARFMRRRRRLACWCGLLGFTFEIFHVFCVGRLLLQ